LRPAFRRAAGALGKLAELLVFPSFCRICSALLESPDENVVCRECLADLVPRRSGFCVVCGEYFGGIQDPHICSECLTSPPPFTRHRSCAPYRGTVKDVLLLFKFRGYAVLGRPLAEFLTRSLGRDEDLWWEIEALVPVPLHPRRERERGFNQAAVLAREIGRIQGLPVLEDVLVRVYNPVPQTSLTAALRQENVKDAYQAMNTPSIQGKRIMLVDDVRTTGATLRECSRVLRDAGAGEVRAVTLAQA